MCTSTCSERAAAMLMQVWMKNVNDESPVFEPRDQVVRVKKGAHTGFVVYTVQAYDPDGDRITFDADSSQLMAPFYCR